MDPKNLTISVVGAGRMGRGIALSYSLAGANVVLIDIKKRDAAAFAKLRASNFDQISLDLEFLVTLGLIKTEAKAGFLDRISVVPEDDLKKSPQHFDIVFEGVPEHREAKQAAFNWINDNIPLDTVIASTTSTFLVNDLASMVINPDRFANAHWLNPAHLMPLVEISKGDNTSEATIENLKSLLDAAGKTTITCGPTPGYIVPRIQVLAMNEAARLAEDGVASIEDIDKAIRLGFGVRYAILGMLEFVDWGGGDILYYASEYLSKTIGKDRYTAPNIIHENMHNERNGIADGKGFYDYENIDVVAYRKQRLQEFTDLLTHLKLAPKICDDP